MWQTLVFPGPVPITTRVKTLSAHEKGLEALPRRRGMWKYLPGSVASVNRGINLRTRQRAFQRISTRVSFKELPVWFLFAGSSQPLCSANSSVVRRPEANSLCLFALYSQRNVKLIYILLLGGSSSEKGLILRPNFECLFWSKLHKISQTLCRRFRENTRWVTEAGCLLENKY